MNETYTELMARIDAECRTAMMGIRGVQSSLILHTGEKRAALSKIAANLRQMADEVERMI